MKREFLKNFKIGEQELPKEVIDAILDENSRDIAAAAEIADMEFNSRLTAAITGAKGKSAKAITALLDLESLKGSKNQEADIKAALEGMKKESGYLFEAETPPPYAAGTGSAPLLGQVTKESFGKLGYRERLELKQNSPELYEQMKE